MLSASTEPYDRGEKFRHYQTLPSLTDYLLVSQHEARVELFSRSGDHFEYHSITGINGTITLPSVETVLALSDVYALIEFNYD